MKNFTKKGILQKTIITIVIALLLSNFIVPTYSHADFGGALMSPIVDLICSLGDAVINLLQVCMTSENSAKLDATVGDGGLSGVVAESANPFDLSKYLVEDSEFFAEENEEYYKEYLATSIPEGATSIKVDAGNDFEKGWFGLSNEYHIPVATYSPEQIFAGNVAGLDINFINPNKYEDREGNNIESSASILQPTIATWYVALRNLTIVGLLSVLVYVGIRIIISGTASDKAKYKQMLVDWLVALCLVFFLHYIMSFTLTLTQSICEAIAGDGETNIYVEVDGGEDNESGIFKTNLLGLARFRTQYKAFGEKMAYLIMYLALVIYTCIFTWFYLKRLLMMAFLTLIAPVVALTYPIDKMNDGKAQAFDAWLKEYVFNALIQPFHLIIYTVFVGTAMDLAANNIIYMIAALAFIMPAEKILRKFFGFEKAGAGTLGALAGGAALGSMASKAIKSIAGGSNKGSSGGNNTKPEGNKPPRFENKNNNLKDIQLPEGEDKNNNDENKDKINTFEDDNMYDYYNNQGVEDNQAIDDRMAQIEGEDYNYTTNPEWMKLNEQKQRQLAKEQEKEIEKQVAKQEQEQEKEAEKQNKKQSFWTGMNNLRKHHNLTRRGIGNAAVRGIKGTAKFATRTAFSAGAGTLAGAIALASGSGLAGAGTAFMTASALGNRAANGVIGVASKLPEIRRREIDVFNGNTDLEEKHNAKAWKKDENNFNYLRDKMTADNGGRIPSDKEVRERMNDFDPYLAKGITDIKDMLKAQKTAQTYHLDPKDMATILAVGKDKGITVDILNDPKKAQAQQANLEHGLINEGLTQEGAKKRAELAMNVLKEQNNVANNLKKPKK